MFSPKKKKLALAIAAAMTLPVVPISALELEEITVTATKRETGLQDTALAISAYDGNTLQENHISDIYDLRGFAPSLQVRHNGDHAVPLVFIRGQGAIDQTEAGDQAVAFYTDGVFAARSQGSTALMYDMERVEVLRGPQGTLFGRNSTAGAISLITNKPVLGELSGSVGLTLGSRNRQEVQGVLNAPVTDNWAIRVAGVTDAQDGETNFAEGNEFSTARNYGTKDLSSYRISSLYQPSEKLSWLLSYEGFENNGTGDVPSADPDNRVNDATGAGNVDLSTDILRTRVDYTLDSGHTLSYIGGYTDMSQSQFYGNQFQGDTRDTVYSGHTSTQHELQLKNSDDERFRWTTGAFFFEEDNDIRFDILHGSWGFTGQDGDGQVNPDGTPDNTVLSTFIQPSRGLDSVSAYVQGTYDVTDSFRLTGGLRYTDDEREDIGGRSIDCTYAQGPGDFDVDYENPADIAAAGEQGCYYRQINDMKDSWSDTTYLARAEWDYSDDVMLYVSYGTGWKSGVLADGNTASATNSDSSPDIEGNSLLIQQPEENDSLEIGIKSTLLDGGMTLNANIFTMDYTDMQVTASVENLVTGDRELVKTNAGAASINGLELESQLLVGDSGVLGFSASVLDASYDEFFGGEGTFGDDDRGLIWNPCAFGADPGGGCIDSTWDFSGNSLPNAPDLSLNLSYKHEFQLANAATLTPRLHLSYQDDIFLGHENRGDRPAGTYGPTDPGESNFDVQEAYTKVNVSLTYASPDSEWSAEIYVNNATDEGIKQELFLGGNVTGYTWAPSRETGLRFRYDFD